MTEFDSCGYPKKETVTAREDQPQLGTCAMNPNPPTVTRKVCPDCGGNCGVRVSREMASDAGDLAMEGIWWQCMTCNGEGLIYE